MQRRLAALAADYAALNEKAVCRIGLLRESYVLLENFY